MLTRDVASLQISTPVDRIWVVKLTTRNLKRKPFPIRDRLQLLLNQFQIKGRNAETKIILCFISQKSFFSDELQMWDWGLFLRHRGSFIHLLIEISKFKEDNYCTEVDFCRSPFPGVGCVSSLITSLDRESCSWAIYYLRRGGRTVTMLCNFRGGIRINYPAVTWYPLGSH